MPAKVILTGIILVILSAILVSMIEFFIPLSAKSDMNVYCRSALLKMEIEGGLSQQDKDTLQTELLSKDFTNITINNTTGAKQGDKLNLDVEADYVYSKLSGLFIRQTTVQHMIYDKTAVARKVIN